MTARREQQRSCVDELFPHFWSPRHALNGGRKHIEEAATPISKRFKGRATTGAAGFAVRR
jgi:hypothetical protein